MYIYKLDQHSTGIFALVFVPVKSWDIQDNIRDICMAANVSWVIKCNYMPWLHL